VATCLLVLVPCLQAHEFWFAPMVSPQAVGDTVTLRLEVGEFFNGEPAGFSIPTAQALRHYSAQGPGAGAVQRSAQVKEEPAQRAGDTEQNAVPPRLLVEDLRPFLPAGEREAEVALALDTPGTHLLAYDSTPLRITLEAGKFHAYLHDEGLDFVKTQREQAGTANLPGRERYRRHIKTLVQVDPMPKTTASQTHDTAHAVQVGQRLEIMPLQNPLALKPGDALPLKIVFDGKPLAGALVKAWHKRKGQLVLIRATTSAQGDVAFDLPYAGDWMVSVVHMVPAVDADEEGVDWDSFWGNLSFHLAQRAMPSRVGRVAEKLLK